MSKFFVAICLLFCVSQGISQDVRQTDYLVYHNQLMQPDTMSFVFWHHGDTLIVKRITEQYIPTIDETVNDFSFMARQKKNAVKGSKLFNGLHISYTYSDEKYMISNDTLYKLVTVNKLSADSLNKLFGREQDGESFIKSNYMNNLQIIAQNRKIVKKPIYHPRFFAHHHTKVFENNVCPDSLTLQNAVVINGKKYFEVMLKYNCENFATTTTVMVDAQGNLFAFDKKYIDINLRQGVNTQPFKSQYTLKQSKK